MQVISADEVLKESGFSPPHLRALVPDQANYKALLMQPEGNITADANGVRHTNAELADKQFADFLRIARETDADLVVTPEYSLPWRILQSFIDSDQIPSEGKIWALGCESIKLDELSAVEANLADKATFLYERLAPDGNRFLNPLVYVFQAPSLEDANIRRLIVLVQFKTCPMGDDQHFEVNGLQRGSRLYRFGGTESQLRLITLICSDAFAFTEALAANLYDRTLVLHVQLNPNPRQNLFRLYRTHLLQYGGDQTEIITLNWAKNIHAHPCTGDPCWKNIAGSGWYLRPDKFDSRDSALQHNHTLGLYYTWLQVDRCHALFFSYAPAVFLVVGTKVAHLRVSAPLSKRLGPKMDKLFGWSSEHDRWEVADRAEDNFPDVAVDAGDAADQLKSLAQTNAIAVERILAICAGQPISRVDWYKVTNLDSCQIDAEEIVRRVTFCHDQEAKATTFRRSRLKAAQRTIRLLNQSLPPSLGDLAEGFRLDWNEASPHTNLVSNTHRRATAIALDENHNRADAEKTRDTVAEYLRRTASSADESIDAMQRLNVWYRDEQGREVLCEPYRFVNYDQTVESPFDIGRAS